ncbi:MAG: amino acid transporter [Methanoculleus sp. SDB]|nr:MAG: amino acid transporter [Methanoculleus sp. SDB]
MQGTMTEPKKEIGYWEATSIGIGGMVGGGIFAVLGLAVQLSGGGTPVAFAIAGVVALITGYSYAKLSVSCPGEGGTVSFLIRAFGIGMFTGSLNVLLWLSYLVMLSLYSYAFGSYGATFFPDAWQFAAKHVLISVSIIAITGLNVLGSAAIGKVEDLIVGLKVGILLLFIALGLNGIHTGYLAPDTWTAPLRLVAGGMIIFIAYEGFELIANTAGDVRDPETTLPRAYYSAILFVIGLYVCIALITVGTLPVESILATRDYALAEAARPFMGQIGFVLIAVAALLSTASAINATLYGASRVSYIIAKDGELPESLEKKIWNKPLEGLFLTAALTLVFANMLDLSSISVMGSGGFLIIFAAVNWANYRLAETTGSNRGIAALGAVVCLVALGALLTEVAQTAPRQMLVLGAMIGISVAIEYAYRTFHPEKRKPKMES